MDQTIEKNEAEVIDSTNDTEEEITLELDEETTDESDKDKKIATLEAQKEHWRKKAQAAEKPVTVEKTETSTLSLKDQMALLKSDVDPDDIDEVLDYAKYKNISVQEALRSTVVKSTLAEKAEMRRTAQATSTSAQRRGNGSVSQDAVLQNAIKGKMPETDEEFEKLFNARKGIK